MSELDRQFRQVCTKTEVSTSSLNGSILDAVFHPQGLSSTIIALESTDVFVPRNKIETTLLLSLLKRSVIIFGTSSNQLTAHRYVDVSELQQLCNELILILVKFNQFSTLLNLLESIAVFANYNSSILFQYGVVLKHLGQYRVALDYLVLVSSVVKSAELYFLIIQILCFHLGDFESGLTWCESLLGLDDITSNEILRSKGHLYTALCCYRKLVNKKSYCQLKSCRDEKKCHLIDSSFNSCIPTQDAGPHVSDFDKLTFQAYIQPCDGILDNESRRLLEEITTHLFTAKKLDPSNHLVAYYLALVNAQLGNITTATHYINQSLKLHSEYLPSLHLLALIESTYNIDQAEQILLSVLEEYPDNVQLYVTLASINSSKEKELKAINNLRQALVVWNNLYNRSDPSEIHETDSGSFSIDKPLFANPPMIIVNVLIDDHSSLKQKSKHVTFVDEAEALEITQVSEKSESFVEDFFSVFNKVLSYSMLSTEKLPKKFRLLVDIWSSFAKVHLKMNLLRDFVQCLDEIFSLCRVSKSDGPPMLYEDCIEIFSNLGVCFIQQEMFGEAKICFDNVLAVRPNCAESLFQKAWLEKEIGHLDEALHCVKHCLQLKNNCMVKDKLYFLLGEIFDSIGEFEKSARCYEIALCFTDCVPVCSFDIIPFFAQ